MGSSSLCEELKTCEVGSIHSRVSAHLDKFTLLDPLDSVFSFGSSVSLAKELDVEFRPFLEEAVKKIQERLKTSMPSITLTSELFRSDTLCLECLEKLFSDFDCQQILDERYALMRRYLTCEQFDKAEIEGFSILGRIPGLKKRGNMVLGTFRKNIRDVNFFKFVVTIMVSEFKIFFSN